APPPSARAAPAPPRRGGARTRGAPLHSAPQPPPIPCFLPPVPSCPHEDPSRSCTPSLLRGGRSSGGWAACSPVRRAGDHRRSPPHAQHRGPALHVQRSSLHHRAAPLHPSANSARDQGLHLRRSF